GSGAPTISPNSGDFNDATTVTINPPLYWQSKSLYYALNSSSDYQQYKGPFFLNNPTTIKAVQMTDGKPGPSVTVALNIRDITPPKVTSAASPKVLGLVKVAFSEMVSRESA